MNNIIMQGSEQWRSLYPFASRYLALDGARMHYVDQGQGPPLLMVHGNPTWSFYYRRMIQEFGASHRTVAPDHIGCGLSDKPQRYPYSLRRHIDNLVDLVEQLDLSDIRLVVHDWGGAIGLGAAQHFPNRISQLIILNTGAFPPPYVPLRIRMCRTPLLGTLAMRGMNAFARAALFMAVNARPLPPLARQGLLAPYDSWRNRVAIDRFVHDIPFSSRHPTWSVLEQVEANLRNLSHLPTMFIWGMKDWCFTETCLKRLQAAFPEARTHRLPEAGHYVLEDAAAEVAALMRDFLELEPVS